MPRSLLALAALLAAAGPVRPARAHHPPHTVPAYTVPRSGAADDQLGGREGIADLEAGSDSEYTDSEAASSGSGERAHGAADEDHLTTKLNDIVSRYNRRGGAGGATHDVRPRHRHRDYHVHYIVHRTPLRPARGHGAGDGIVAEDRSAEETREHDESPHAEHRAVDAGHGQHEPPATPSLPELLHQREPDIGSILHEIQLKLEPPAPPAAATSPQSSAGLDSEEQGAAAGLYSDDDPALESSAESAQYLFEEPAPGGLLLERVVAGAAPTPAPAPAAPADCAQPTKELRPACEDCQRNKSYTLMFLFNK